MSRAKEKQKRKAAKAGENHQAAQPSNHQGARTASYQTTQPTNPIAAAAVGKSGVMLVVGAVVVLLLSYGAALAGFADGTIDMFLVAGSETTTFWIALQAFFNDYYDFWQSQWGTPNHFIDLGILAPLFLAFGYAWGVYVFCFVVILISAAGWILLSAAVFGKSASRAAFILLAHALPLLYMASFGGNVFFLMVVPAYRFAPFVLMPCLLWLAARCLQSGNKSFIIALSAATAFITLSNQIMVAWFCAPLAAALLLMLYADGKGKKHKNSKRHKERYKITLAAVVIGAIIGRVASSAVPFAYRNYIDRVYSAPEFKHIFDTIANLMDYAWIITKTNPISAMVWLAFVVIAGRRFLLSLPPKAAMMMAVERRVLFLFVPLAMLATFGAVIATGLFPFFDVESFFQAGGFGGKRYMDIPAEEASVGITTSYLLPVIFLPLFFGWVLYLPTLRTPIIGAALALTGVLAMAKTITLDFDKVNPYSHPFYACLHDAAKKYNAKGIISAADSREVFAFPEWRWHSYMSVGAARGGENSFLYMDRTYRAHIAEGSFDFVLANADKGKFSYSSPGREPRVCDYDQWHQCVRQVHPAIILDGQAIRGAFGEPQNIIHCPGNSAIYRYAPPIVIPDILKGKQAGEKFSAQGWQMPNDGGG